MNFPSLILDLASRLVALQVLASVLLAVAGVFALLSWRASAAVRHLIWTLALAGCLALPLLTVVLPEASVPVGPVDWSAALQPVTLDAPLELPAPSRMPAEAPAAGPAETNPVSESAVDPAPTWKLPNLLTIVLGIFVTFWAIGAPTLAVSLIRVNISQQRLVAGARPVEDSEWLRLVAEAERAAGREPGSVRLLRSDEEHSPMAADLPRTVVVIPRSADELDRETRLQILHHETAHLCRRDSLSHLMSLIVTVLYFGNPLVLLAFRRMIIERERACDDWVLGRGADPTSYAHYLLGLARGLTGPALQMHLKVAMARRSEMSGRLMAILDTHRNRRAPGRVVWSGSVLTMLVLTVGLGVIAPGGRAAPALFDGLESDFESVVAASGRDAADWTRDEIRAAIEEANRTIERAVADHDLEAMLRPYSSGMHLLAMGGAEGVGTEDMRAALRVMQENYAALEIETQEVEIIHDGLVFETGTYRYHEGKQPKSLSGRYLNVWRYEDGRWMIYRDISNF